MQNEYGYIEESESYEDWVARVRADAVSNCPEIFAEERVGGNFTKRNGSKHKNSPWRKGKHYFANQETEAWNE